ncbi:MULTISPECIES: ATP-dependent DNA helicase [Trichocoleus]|uniref:ATP-dependent DNA helicase n=1 Tax=Trichocoleus desertorum GB2-A4 TaxID=2933944 RepID=A0ABV0J656_9CYAN|nr:ATP-dependent DNA helicase [Trichocoleus sp. FACHB-46]MBD1861978.1 ATP-dependent DNA helicase [Trichocoleus sp. FACHB-46]
MIEVEVHQQLRAFLREQGEPYWPHHLTMGRLVARALRLGRSALIQAGAPSGSHGRYRLSYLVPLLIWPGSAVLAVPEEVQQRLLMVEIPRLRQWIQTHKPILTGDRWPGLEFQGLLLTTPEEWLSDRLTDQSRFPQGIPTIVDGVDDLEAWAQSQLTARLEPSHWNDLMLARPEQAEAIRDVRVQLTRAIFQHPANPYECYLVESEEQEILHDLFRQLNAGQASVQETEASGEPSSLVTELNPPLPSPTLPDAWSYFWQRLQSPDQLVWATISRQHGQFSLHCGPVDVAPVLEKIWPQQPVVLIGGALDLEAEATIYRQRLGLKDLTCLKFAPDRQSELVQLYLPDGLPMPNTPQFQTALLQEVRALLNISLTAPGLTVLLVGDVPLKAQIGSVLAGEFGSRVQVEKTCLDDNGILVTGWEFWRQYQHVLPAPHLLAIATLPIPSLEHPLVAGRVAYYKRLRQDWFRLYLLPTALSELQRAIAPVRECQGVVALLDNRVLHRSYGHQVLAALSPLARINYLDPGLFNQSDYSVLD